MSNEFDYIIVGGGTAGCVVAARLTENPGTKVLLLEAGPDYPTNEATPEGVHESRYVPMRGHAPEVDPRHDWGLNIEMNGSTIVVPQARLIGGGSAINGTLALRGATADYAEWAAAGNPDWSWDHVLPAFRDLEDDTAPGAGIHGRGGPYPITRTAEPELAPLQKAFVDSARSVGATDCWDFNSPDAEGVGPVPQSRAGNRRISTAIAYLNPVRHRENLTVRGEVLVSRVLFDGTRATGVELANGTTITASEVVLSAGAIVTPALLQRSGVGPAGLLAAMDVQLISDLPVGENLADHSCVPLMAPPREGSWTPDDASLQAVWRFSSSLQPESLDAQLTMFSYLNVRTTGEGARGMAGAGNEGLDNVAGVGCVINKPRSTGVVQITSTDPTVLPFVDPRYLTDPIDLAVMREIVRRGWKVLTAAPLAGMLEEPLGMDADTVADDDALDAAIHRTIASGYHFTGTCKMAPVDNGGVVDQNGLVYGCEGLRVIDASVLPTIPAANPMLPIVMVAERLAALARGKTVGGPKTEENRDLARTA